MLRKVSILGSTGQIGTQALEVIRSYQEKFEVIGLACGHQSAKFNEQVAEFKPKITAISQEDGEEKLIQVAIHPEVDLVIVAVVGMAGLLPTLKAIQHGKDIALATKEILVIAGDIVMKEVEKNKVTLIPIDSEHSALFQAVPSGKLCEIKELILTMGEGDIARMKKSQLKKVTVVDVCQRKTWTMGQKIAVDSATGVNKAFEVIEAKWLFGVARQQITIVVHPEYFCHSLLEFVDGSIITELGVPDMKRYIQYALFYPDRAVNNVSLQPNIIGKQLSFKRPPLEKFPCLALGHLALASGGTMPAVLHGADRAAVAAFLHHRMRFTDFYRMITMAMKAHRTVGNPSLNQLIKAEEWGYQFACDLLRQETT